MAPDSGCACSWPSFGAVRAYEELRGSPHLRARHEPFRIGAREHDAWLEHMTAAMEEIGLGALEETQLLSYFKSVASHLVNTRDDIDLDAGPPGPVRGTALPNRLAARPMSGAVERA